MEKRRSEQKTVHKLVVNGEDITNRPQILEEQRFFFETLYKRKHTNMINVGSRKETKKEFEVEPMLTVLTKLKRERAKIEEVETFTSSNLCETVILRTDS
ncbi:hypothetical protein DPMN_143196 [Dreissena polymorpha]|uniref:Uncharacterized protein n=1 Tax=Dreissena polymorpha TaxID=45954 RepID=A0A9D4GCQ3_DREPO|nr:hypothetical protein DPMN_143196 [Dreissena polymorpha]